MERAIRLIREQISRVEEEISYYWGLGQDSTAEYYRGVKQGLESALRHMGVESYEDD